MNIPEFTAEASLYKGDYHMNATGILIKSVLPQAMLPGLGAEGMLFRKPRVICDALSPEECQLIGINAPWGCMLCIRLPGRVD
jgi:hypothetical protein